MRVLRALAEGMLRGVVIKCSPGYSVGQPWVLGLLAQVVWPMQSGPRTGPHFPPITAKPRLHGVEVHPDGCCPWRSRTGCFCSACFLRLRLAFYIAHASIQTTRSSYTRSTSQARPSTHGWPHPSPAPVADMPAWDALTWVACPLLCVGVRQRLPLLAAPMPCSGARDYIGAETLQGGWVQLCNSVCTRCCGAAGCFT